MDLFEQLSSLFTPTSENSPALLDTDCKQSVLGQYIFATLFGYFRIFFGYYKKLYMYIVWILSNILWVLLDTYTVLTLW